MVCSEGSSLPIEDQTPVQFRDWTRGRFLPSVGTNSGATLLPFQGWRNFKEAFAPEIVERALTETDGPVQHIVDPFGGSGTTALAAQFLGVRPTTIEVNPFLADLIEAKLGAIDLDLAEEAFARVCRRAKRGPRSGHPAFPGAPHTFVEPGQGGRYIFSRPVAQRILAYRNAIDRVSDPACQRLFRVILAASLIPVSNVTVSGKGRRYRRGWRRRERDPEMLDRLFQNGTTQALDELGRFARRLCRNYTLLRGDARVLAQTVGPHDLVVFSPPYPNSFDYTDVYNVELWTMGYLRNSADNRTLRHATIRSHVQLLRDFADALPSSPTLRATVNALREVRGELWNRHIPEMIGGYAADLRTVLNALHRGLRNRGRVYMVMGDSQYAGVTIPTAKIVVELALSLGYRLISSEPSRSIRSSPQQGGRSELTETLVTLEKAE